METANASVRHFFRRKAEVESREFDEEEDAA